MKQATHIALLIVGALTLFGCNESAFMMAADRAGDTGGYWGSPEANDMGTTSSDMGATGTTSTGEPEASDDAFLLPPAQTDVFVFIANPERDTVTRVNVLTNEVRTTQVGREPSTVLTTPDYRHAAVFNQGDDSVSIITSATLDVLTVPVRDNFNRMVMSPNGTWVGLWHDQQADEDGSPDGLQSFNEVSFVNLLTAEHFPMAVGFNPRRVVFTPDESLASVVSDAYLALVDLTADQPLPDLIGLTDDLINPPAAEEVLLSPDGSFAFVRQFGVEDLVVVDLATRAVDLVPVGSNPTDMDLSPAGDEAYIVARGSNEVHILDTSDPFSPATIIELPEGIPLGSLLLDPTGDLGVIYTTSSNLDVYATWDRTTDDVQLRPLIKPVTGMAITPTGESMMAFHTKEDAEGASSSSPFYNSWALSLISLTNNFLANPLRLDGEPIGHTNGSNGNHGYFIMDGEDALVQIDYRTLLHETIALRSAPVFVGVLPDLDAADGDEPKAWVSQEHPLGRISFFDPDDASVETITGFELNSEIEGDNQ